MKIGILGGTFDPPHVGHLNISLEAIKRFQLNKVIWLITKKNPLKKKSASNDTSNKDQEQKIDNVENNEVEPNLENNLEKKIEELNDKLLRSLAENKGQKCQKANLTYLLRKNRNLSPHAKQPFQLLGMTCRVHLIKMYL